MLRFNGPQIQGPGAELVSALEGRDDDTVLLSLHPKRLPFRRLPYYTASFDPNPSLVQLDLRTTRTTAIEEVPLVGARLLADHENQVRFALGYDREALSVVLWRPNVKAK